MCQRPQPSPACRPRSSTSPYTSCCPPPSCATSATIAPNPRPPWALALVTAATALTVVAQNRLAGSFDPTLTIVPVAVGAVTTAVVRHMRGQAVRLRDSEREAGMLAERQRLSMEIHDALAQGLT